MNEYGFMKQTRGTKTLQTDASSKINLIKKNTKIVTKARPSSGIINTKIDGRFL